MVHLSTGGRLPKKNSVILTSLRLANSISNIQDEVPLDRDMITVGKSKFVNVRVGGWFVPAIQARIIREGESFTILNVGKKGKTRVNGDEVTRQDIKNGDIIEVGNSVFRFVEAG
jgi:pSer/pThr/pTyr-binding forkhead associated (FHA) protein